MERPETHELKYMHFSVAVSKSRRMPIFSACNIKGAAAKTTFWLTPNTATCDCASSRAPFFRQMLDPVQFKAEVLFESPNHVCFLMCIPKSQESGRAMLRPYAFLAFSQDWAGIFPHWSIIIARSMMSRLSTDLSSPRFVFASHFVAYISSLDSIGTPRIG